MVVNPALLLVSALFFLALASLFYLVAWGAASLGLRAGRGRVSHAAAKRLLLLCLMLPPALALIPTFGGATLRHSHMTAAAEHHSPMCRQLFVPLFSAETFSGSVLTVSEIAGRVINSAAWLLIGLGVFFLLRLVWATAKLETGLLPFLYAPSDRLGDALARVKRQMPGLPAGRFYECALPAAYSSVLGLRRVRCVLSRELVATATDEELDAVIAHEAGHLTAHDVPAAFVVGALSCLFFPLRPVRLLARVWREEAELACDDAAVAATRRPLALAAAILRAVGVPVSPSASSGGFLPAVAMSFAGADAASVGRRVERLLAQAQAVSAPAPLEESPRHVLAGWLTTGTLAGVGTLVLFSPEMLCYAHCTLEAVARLLP